MFQSARKRLEAVLDVVDDMLVGAPDPDEPAVPLHPHRRPVELRIQRRGGSVTPRTMHCLCPVRPGSASREAEVRHAHSS